MSGDIAFAIAMGAMGINIAISIWGWIISRKLDAIADAIRERQQ